MPIDFGNKLWIRIVGRFHKLQLGIQRIQRAANAIAHVVRHSEV